MNKFFLFVFINLFILIFYLESSPLVKNEAFISLESSISNYGGTGLIMIPNANVLGKKHHSAGIHSYNIKYNYSFFPKLEMGLKVNASDYNEIEKIIKKITFNTKYQFLSFSNDLKFAIGENDKFYYLVCNKYIKDKITNGFIEANIGIGTSEIKNFSKKNNLFCSISKILYSSYMIIIEYDSFGLNLGMRMLLAPRWKVDLYMINISDKQISFFEKIIFGINYYR